MSRPPKPKPKPQQLDPLDEQIQVIRYHLEHGWHMQRGHCRKPLDPDGDNPVNLLVYPDLRWRVGYHDAIYARSTQPAESLELAKLACLEAALQRGVVLEPKPPAKIEKAVSLQHIADCLGCSHQHVLNQENRALKKMRNALEARGLSLDDLMPPKRAGGYHI